MAAPSARPAGASRSDKKSSSAGEKIVAGFNKLRGEQRALAAKSAQLDMELTEHNLVIDALRDVDPERRCYRMVGGVLVERTVKEVLPALQSNKEQISRLLEALAQQVSAKGREINEYREKHNIRVRGEADPVPLAAVAATGTGTGDGDGDGQIPAKPGAAGVLVSETG
ncbi:prefoldin subunit 2 [Petromyzon marinus]|uniref:prefoldin subunit 2 n=1 Tax=Petromyzon marinus TaxID=7757 RepID=UPI003F730AA0